ncbi:RNA polymerase sigma factor SigZ [Paenibacillus psychroresistens]|uniref:RNA polymerase sigma factor SigZ n=1 Tax=Paenibacillus psychroresistens TaxID=1778678 RepID=A0A6B8RKQ4_9BACL|nr:RNA polymerase sigma factor SigZ [Paenibacillus psychroresistens]QGQ96619.1 RNA polymerase sigma factor SigZ [Paenibacillus psychroresistens]
MQSEKVWRSFSDPLKQFIGKRVSNEFDTDDILQDVFIKIHLHINNLQDDKNIHSWIYQITRHTIIDFYRRRKRDSSSTQTIIEQEDLFFPDSSDAHVELAKCLKEMVNDLPVAYRDAIQSTEFEGMTQKELGTKMGLSLSGAKSRVQRARGKLQEMLLTCCQIELDRRGTVISYTPYKVGCADNCTSNPKSVK